MARRFIGLLAGWCLGAAQSVSAADDFPAVAPEFEVALFAKEPLVRNPCAIAFDSQGRLCVGMGPQYRHPKPATPGDSVFLLLDENGDGVADARKEFATGFNAIQGLAWKGRDLWVANAPDLTIARDLDGDDSADEYVRVYTDLGNIEHGLHGLNWAPDGKLYMSKGNSKGLTQPPARVAPKPFRELWNIVAPPGTPDFRPPAIFKKGEYRANYHDPADDWGLTGGVLRCDEGGRNLEIVSRGLRNPWDIAFDDEFHWLGTDNDQTLGDKFFAPFFDAHFGWGHAWSFDWRGDNHLPTVPASGPLFEGSGTGVIFCGLPEYPEKYRGVFFVNDWLKRQIYIYRPKWDGALRVPQTEKPDLLADAGSGRSMESSSGRSFDPVDIEIGPDGAVWISSWGRQYGAVVRNGEMVNEGRIYRLWPRAMKSRTPLAPRRMQPMEKWTTAELIEDLAGHLPVWRINAREELVRRGTAVAAELEAVLRQPASTALETWAAWTLGSLRMADPEADAGFAELAGSGATLNVRIQSLRILAHRARERGSRELSIVVREMLANPEPRLRHEAVLAVHQAGETRWSQELLALAGKETDRVVFYSTWRALRRLMAADVRHALLKDARPGVRRAALLGLLEDDVLTEPHWHEMARDPDAATAALARKRLGGKHQPELRGPPAVAARGSQPEGAGAAPLQPIVSAVSRVGAQSGRVYREARLEVGQLAYTDRNYRIREVPPELSGDTFLQSANDDAEAEEGTALTIQLRHPSTVFLADDERGGALPKWAAAVFRPTDLTLRTDDAHHRIYQAELPAGEVTFGGNKDGIAARKANYLVIIRPMLLEPPTKPTAQAEVEPLLAGADAQRGRSLFLSKGGAGCASCHRLEGIGNLFAPDLADIGSRATPEFIVRSILEPSAVITEGFAMRVVTSKSGEAYAGVVLEETAQSVKMGMLGGVTATVKTADIATHETQSISAMPAIFASMLRSQDIADITTYLMTLTKPAPAAQSATSAAPALLAQSGNSESKGFHLVRSDDRLEIALGGQRIATYYHRHPQVKRPFFAHVKTPGGIPVTRNFPPVKGQDPDDHADMHPGLSLGFAVLDGVNFWHNKEGVVVHEAFAGEPAAGEVASFVVNNRYLAPGGRLICREQTGYRFSPNADGYLIAIDARFTSDQQFSFGVKEEMGLAVRVASPLRVRDGKGEILSGSGGRNERGTWGKVDVWWDYFGPINERSVGLHVMSAPGNPPVWAHSRDYGVLVANPFPVDREENRGKKITVAPGEEFRLRFGIQVHEHAARAAFDPAKSYQRYVDEAL